jgi:hypothetical protein
MADLKRFDMNFYDECIEENEEGRYCKYSDVKQYAKARVLEELEKVPCYCKINWDENGDEVYHTCYRCKRIKELKEVKENE